MPNLCTYLISRLLKIKMRYEDIFHEKLNIYDKVIENTIDNIKDNIIYNSLKIQVNIIIIYMKILNED